MQERIEALRHRGCRGGIILKHRSLLTSPRRSARFFRASVLIAAFLALWCLSLDLVSAFWASVLNFWQSNLGLDGYVSLIHYQFNEVIRFNVPYLYVHAGMSNNDLWWGGVIATAVLVLVSLVLPHRLLPFAYLMRIVAFFQGCAQAFFALWPGSFPYSASGYIHGNLIACMMLITLMPVALGLTYYVFDFKLSRKVALTAMVMLHLMVMVPLQYVLHAYILHHLSLLFMPLLFFVGGLPLNVLVFIAFYSWGFSWRDELHRDDYPLQTLDPLPQATGPLPTGEEPPPTDEGRLPADEEKD